MPGIITGLIRQIPFPWPAATKHTVPSLVKRTSILVGATKRALRPIAKITNIAMVQAYAGNGVLSGMVKIGNTPVSRQVRLYAGDNGILLMTTISGVDGKYTFSALRTGVDYTVTAHDLDYAGNYNDVIAARVRAI